MKTTKYYSHKSASVTSAVLMLSFLMSLGFTGVAQATGRSYGQNQTSGGQSLVKIK